MQDIEILERMDLIMTRRTMIDEMPDGARKSVSMRVINRALDKLASQLSPEARIFLADDGPEYSA